MTGNKTFKMELKIMFLVFIWSKSFRGRTPDTPLCYKEYPLVVTEPPPNFESIFTTDI